MIDKRALQILTKTYWSSTGWRDKPSTSKEDFEYAKSKGMMFDPVKLNHDQAVVRAGKSAASVTRKMVSDAFLASLTTRRLDLRSALGSFAVGRKLPQHAYAPTSGMHCSVCGESKGGSRPEDLSVLNFERFKWGGVRHDSPYYIAVDLERLHESENVSPSPDDILVLRKILAAATSLPPKASLSQLLKTIAPLFPASANERQTLVAILGYSGILQPKSHPSFFTAFVEQDSREESSNDWPFPICWWRGADGVNWKAAEFWFPQLKT